VTLPTFVVPPAHEKHDVLPWKEVDPVSQLRQVATETAASVIEYVPAPHAVSTLAPGPL